MTENAPRAVSAEDLRDEFLGTCRLLADHAIAEIPSGGRAEVAGAVEGLLRSILSIFDGADEAFPPYDLVARPGPYNKEDRLAEGLNWIEPGTVINADRELHKLVYRGSRAGIRVAGQWVRP